MTEATTTLTRAVRVLSSVIGLLLVSPADGVVRRASTS